MVAFFWLAQYSYVPNTAPYLLAQKVTADFIGIIVGVYGGIQMIIRFPLGMFADWMGQHKYLIVLGTFCSGSASVIRLVFSNGDGFLVANLFSGVASAMWLSFLLLYTRHMPPSRMQSGLGMMFAANNAGILIAFIISATCYKSFGMDFLCTVSVTAGFIACAIALTLHEHDPYAAAAHQAVQAGAGAPADATEQTGAYAPADSTVQTGAYAPADATEQSGAHAPADATEQPGADLPADAEDLPADAAEAERRHGKVSFSGLFSVAFKGQIWFFAMLGMLQQGVTMSTVMSFSNEAAYKIGGDSFDTGLMTVVYITFTIISSYYAGHRLFARLGAALPLVSSLVMLAVYCYLSVRITDITVMIALQSLLGLTFGFVFSIATAKALEGIEGWRRSSALGLFQAAFALGMFFVPIAAGALIELDKGDLTRAFDWQGHMCMIGTVITIIYFAVQRAAHRKALKREGK